MDSKQLRSSNLAELEQLYAQDQNLTVPRGCFRGVHLRRLDEPGARRPGHLLSRPFQVVPFGIDFDSRCWFFGDRRLQVGRFSPELGRSQWRDTSTLRLLYGISRLPLFVRSVLYDEVKPLSPDLCLGIGGLWAERGAGDHFFFALERMG
jgi:hypothetical protein